MRKLTQTTPRQAFTLVELLTVIAIISLLVGLLYPSLGRARQAAMRTVCATRLHGVATALRMYLNDYHDFMPVAARLPSAQLNDKPRFADVMALYLEAPEALHCPADKRRDPANPQWSSFFESDGSSYEYNSSLGGERVDRNFLVERFGQTQTPVCFDYEPFHGDRGQPRSRVYLMADGRVGELGSSN